MAAVDQRPAIVNTRSLFSKFIEEITLSHCIGSLAKHAILLQNSPGEKSLPETIVLASSSWNHIL